MTPSAWDLRGERATARRPTPTGMSGTAFTRSPPVRVPPAFTIAPHPHRRRRVNEPAWPRRWPASRSGVEDGATPEKYDQPMLFGAFSHCCSSE